MKRLTKRLACFLKFILHVGSKKKTTFLAFHLDSVKPTATRKFEYSRKVACTVAYRGFLKGGGGMQPQSNMLSGKFFPVLKKVLHFESVSVLSIFHAKNIVI